MAKVRVYELAKEFGVETKVLLAELKRQGEFLRSASSTIEAPTVRRLRAAADAGRRVTPGAPMRAVTTCDDVEHPAWPVPPGRALRVPDCPCGTPLHEGPRVRSARPTEVTHTPDPNPAHSAPPRSAEAPASAAPKTASRPHIPRRPDYRYGDDEAIKIERIARAAGVSSWYVWERLSRGQRSKAAATGRIRGSDANVLVDTIRREREQRAKVVAKQRRRRLGRTLSETHGGPQTGALEQRTPRHLPPGAALVADLATELRVTRRQLSDAAVMDGQRLIEDGVVPAALVERYREKGREWVLQRAGIPERPTVKTPSSDPLVDEPPTTTAGQAAPGASVQPVVVAGGTLTRDEAVTTRERLRSRPPAGHGEAVRTTRTDTMFWATAEAQTAFDAVTTPDGDPIELALPPALLLFTDPTDPRGRRGVDGAVRGMSWTYLEHTTTVLVYLWQDTDDDTLLPTPAFTIDLSDPWPTSPGPAGSTDEVAFLLGRWWTVAAEQHGMDHPHEPPAPSRGATSEPRHPHGSGAGREQVQHPAVSFRTWRIRPPSTRRMDATSPVGRAPVRRHVVRTHLHTYATGPDRSERVKRLVLSYTRGGGSAAGRGDRVGLTVYVLRP